MANQKHLDILRLGVETWNKWRQENPDIQPDFRQAELNNINFDKIDLNNADFNGANLKGATLNEANLRAC
ncbi:MAG TPA: pentapeptide repeat-containing protein [Ktedonobacteraceae bacterium]|nr:pentapeptide repeat-containing protein [Ktedonobacteraceae bacterium]